MPKFTVTLSVDIEVDEAVFAQALTDEWRAAMYDFMSRAEVVEHLAFNLVQGRTLKSLDGFANLPEDAAKISNLQTEDSTLL